MSNTAKKNVTPSDVAAKAVEENLVEATVPAQGQNPSEEKVDNAEGQPELTVIEGEKGSKKTLKERLTAVSAKIEANKKTFIAVGVAAAAAAVAIAKVSAKKALEQEALKESETPDENEVYQEMKDKAIASDDVAV